MAQMSTSLEKSKNRENPGADLALHGSLGMASTLRDGKRSKGIASSTHRERSPKSIVSQKEFWKLEQQVVSSLVRVEPDPVSGSSDLPDNELFRLLPQTGTTELYGGVDVSFPASDDEESVAVYVVVDQRTMKVVYRSHEYFTLDIPYIPGFLAFREIAPLERLVKQQIQNHPEFTPKAILVDGNGILHPRHAGIACFLGTRIDIPTIGIGKTLMNVGGWRKDSVEERIHQFVTKIHTFVESTSFAEILSQHRGTILETTDSLQSVRDQNMAEEHGASQLDLKQALQDLAPYSNGLAIPLVNDESMRGSIDETDSHRFPVLGYALVGHGGQTAARTRAKGRPGSSKPIFVSVGHRMSVQTAVQIVSALSLHRIPEPVRQADLYGRELMRQRVGVTHPPAPVHHVVTPTTSGIPQDENAAMGYTPGIIHSHHGAAVSNASVKDGSVAGVTSSTGMTLTSCHRDEDRDCSVVTSGMDDVDVGREDDSWTMVQDRKRKPQIGRRKGKPQSSRTRK